MPTGGAAATGDPSFEVDYQADIESWPEVVDLRPRAIAGEEGEDSAEDFEIKRGCADVMQPEFFVVDPAASVNLPKDYTCAQRDQPQPPGYNYRRACGAPIVREIHPDVVDSIKQAAAEFLPKQLRLRSIIGGASGKRTSVKPTEFKYKGKRKEGFEHHATNG